MRLLRFISEDIHGYLNHDFEFNEGLTLLTGINGSGKTSVVRSVVALLAPNIRYLAQTQFRTLTIEFEHNRQSHRVRARSRLDAVVVSTDKLEEPLRLPRLHHRESLPTKSGRDEDAEYFSRLELSLSDNPVLQFLQSLPTPMFLDLERRSPETRKRWSGGLFSAGSRAVFGGTTEESLAIAQEVAREAFGLGQAAQQRLADKSRADLILSAFELGQAPDDTPAMPTATYRRDLDRREQLLIESLLKLGIERDRVNAAVEPFFSHLKGIVRELPKRGTLSEVLEKIDDLDDQAKDATLSWLSLRPQANQISRFVSHLEHHQRLAARVEERQTSYLHAVNRFLSESGKELSFEGGRLKVSVPSGQKNELDSLSSGERQIVVILTHLAFNELARTANVLIIDEPELSLHIRWQEMFVDSVELVRPNLQFILATHSPSIIMDRIAACVDLSGAFA